MRGRLTIGLAGALGALALLPGAAAGSTAMLGGGDTLLYNAAAGEANNLTVERSGANYVLTDTGAAITPTAPCAAVTANQVTCPAAPVTDVDINLGDLADTGAISSSVANAFDGNTNMDGQDGNDSLTTSAPLAEFLLLGGPGEDSLTGGPGRDRLIGGDGNDVHSGNGGPDRFDEGLGDDVYDGGAGDDDFGQTSLPQGADTFIGGAGDDNIDFQSRTLALTIDLDGVADDGEGCPGAGCEGDNVMADVETISGGRGSDSITGAAGAQRIRGNPGNDVIDGGAGDDDLHGDDGDDMVIGGDGDDDVDGDEGADVSQGGPGDDQIGGRFNDGGADSLSGGTGLDSTTAFSASPVQIDLDGVADDGPIAGDAPKDNVLGDMENIETGIGDDTLIGNDAANELIGGGGNDTLIGGGGADGLFGNEGNDTSTAAPRSTPSTAAAAPTRCEAATTPPIRSTAAPPWTPFSLTSSTNPSPPARRSATAS